MAILCMYSMCKYYELTLWEQKLRSIVSPNTRNGNLDGRAKALFYNKTPRNENNAVNWVNQVPIASTTTEQDQTYLKGINANGESLLLLLFCL